MLIISLILWARELGTRPTLFLYKFYWIVVGLQCCVSFRCTIKWFNFIYTYIHAFSDSFSIEVITEYCGEFFRLVVCLIYTRWVGPDGWNGIKQWSEPSILALAKLLNEHTRTQFSSSFCLSLPLCSWLDGVFPFCHHGDLADFLWMSSAAVPDATWCPWPAAGGGLLSWSGCALTSLAVSPLPLFSNPPPCASLPYIITTHVFNPVMKAAFIIWAIVSMLSILDFELQSSAL